MRKTLTFFVLVLLVAGCSQRQEPAEVDTAMQCVATFQLNKDAALRLCTDGDMSMLELTYGGERQEIIGVGNTMFVTDDNGCIVLDTVHLEGGSHPTHYIVRTADRSSTYGAEVWYVAYPLYPKLEYEEACGPWSLAMIPWDLPGLEVINNDTFLVYYEYGHTGRYTAYAFEAGIFREIPSLSTLR